MRSRSHSNSHAIAATNALGLTICCWSGPRNQAERKYKFRIVNQSNDLLNIDGGTRSAIRLLVAYPRSAEPRLTLPQAHPDDEFGEFGSPKKVLLDVATHHAAKAPAIKGEVAGENRSVPRADALWVHPQRGSASCYRVCTPPGMEGR